MAITMEYRFASVHELRRWLNRQKDKCSTPDEFYEWIERLFDKGDTIVVLGEDYDYFSILELI